MSEVGPVGLDADVAEVSCRPGELPEDLELIPPGPGLVAVLERVDRAGLSGGDRLRLAAARNRVVAWSQAQLYADIYATCLDETAEDGCGGVDPGAGRYPWTEVELAFALRWTRQAAGVRLEQARQLVEDFPVLFDALAAGRVDVPKVLVICEVAGWLEDLPTARALVDRVVTRAEGWTTGQLRARLRRWVLAADPEAATRRAVVGVASRRVQTLVNEDGTGEMWGRSLPPQDCAAAWERLGAIARAAKAAGDQRSLEQLRADAFLDLLVGDGVAAGGQVGVHTAGLPAHPDPLIPAASAHAPMPEPASGGGGTPAPIPAPAWDPSWPAEPPPPTLDDPPPRRVGPDPAIVAAYRPNPTQPVAGGPAAAMPAPRKGVVEIQVPLLTLLRLAEHPGELAGWGPVVADIAAQIATRHTDGTWRFHILNELGEITRTGITRQRPIAAITTHVRARDHTCVAPGCRHPARSCDVDHTLAKADHGHSGPGNLGCLCRTHHRFKHTQGAHLIQFTPGTFGWTTPRGLQYTRRPHHPLAD